MSCVELAPLEHCGVSTLLHRDLWWLEDTPCACAYWLPLELELLPLEQVFVEVSPMAALTTPCYHYQNYLPLILRLHQAMNHHRSRYLHHLISEYQLKVVAVCEQAGELCQALYCFVPGSSPLVESAADQALHVGFGTPVHPTTPHLERVVCILGLHQHTPPLHKFLYYCQITHCK